MRRYGNGYNQHVERSRNFHDEESEQSQPESDSSLDDFVNYIWAEINLPSSKEEVKPAEVDFQYPEAGKGKIKEEIAAEEAAKKVTMKHVIQAAKQAATAAAMAAQEAAKEAAQEAAQDAAKEVVKEIAKQSAKELVEKAIKEQVEKAIAAAFDKAADNETPQATRVGSTVIKAIRGLAGHMFG